MATMLVRSKRPFTRLPRRSASNFRSRTWYAGVFFRGAQARGCLSPASDARWLFTTDRSTTLGDEAYLMTSLNSSLDSAARVRREMGAKGSSDSESDVSDPPDGTNGGVGRRLIAFGRSGNDSISRRRSWPLRNEFSVRRNRTVPRRASICKIV